MMLTETIRTSLYIGFYLCIFSLLLFYIYSVSYFQFTRPTHFTVLLFPVNVDNYSHKGILILRSVLRNISFSLFPTIRKSQIPSLTSVKKSDPENESIEGHFGFILICISLPFRRHYRGLSLDQPKQTWMNSPELTACKPMELETKLIRACECCLITLH